MPELKLTAGELAEFRSALFDAIHMIRVLGEKDPARSGGCFVTRKKLEQFYQRLEQAAGNRLEIG